MSLECVQVALRIRPLVPSELDKGCKDVLEVFPEESQVRIRNSDRGFTYNHVFSSDTEQETVYKKCVKPMLDNVFKGYNITILAYGQTGSGKTHTMGTAFSGEGEMGIIQRAVTDMFMFIKDNFTYDFFVSVSFMELYQEVLYDLLSDKSRDKCVLDIREDAQKSVMIPGLTEVTVQSVKDVFDALLKGSLRRVTGATNMNSQSSRSHAIFTVNLAMQSKVNKADNKTAKFNLVDLAGSERQKKTGAIGNTFKEGVNINKGLLVLGNVISALGDDKQQHGYIPYRDSNLTRLLKDSLGGNSVTLMIACVSPADYNVEETVSTMRYADRARRIQNKPIVNQDPKVAEINDLKKQIQQLKLQIVGQGGPVPCLGELELLKKENLDQQKKIRDLTFQLSSSLNANTGLLEKVLILQTANENLTKKILQLKDDYDITFNNISIGIDNNDAECLKANLTKLQSIKEQFIHLDSEQKKTEIEIIDHENNLQNSEEKCSGEDSSVITKNHEQFTNQQIALKQELEVITRELALKEHLARQIQSNTNFMVDYNAINENESKIKLLEKEKEDLLLQLKNAQNQGAAGKIAEQRRIRVQELEMQIQDLKKKVQEHARLVKMKAKDEIKIKHLNAEILQMKQAKIKLIKTMREESDKFKLWKIEREREVAKLKQQDRKRQNQIVKMEVMHNKQQNVLKRKFEEATALNKRLKDALALRKAAQEMKHSKGEKIEHWAKQEIVVYVNLVEAEATLAGLLEDRATLQEQLTKLKQDETPDESLIKSIEDDIEFRSIQIQDLQQKILDSDEDAKSKTRFDNIQTMHDAKIALRTLLAEAGEIKKGEIALNSKLIDAQAALTECIEKNDELKLSLKRLEQSQEEKLSSFQKEYEDKIALLLRQLRGVQAQSIEEEQHQELAVQTMQQERIEKIEKELQQLRDENEEYKRLLGAIELQKLAKEEKPLLEINGFSNGFKTPENPRVKKAKQDNNSKTIDTTFVVNENQENMLDSSVEDLNDDVFKDPDWRKTPIGKFLKQQRTTMAADVTSRAFKRTSGGGCMCVKSKCATKTCGCRKFNKGCSEDCKCSAECLNKISTSESV